MNVIKSGASTFLLTRVAGGSAVHLTPEEPEAGRGAVEEFWLDDERDVPTLRNYDRTDLLEQRWSARTLCGGARQWAVMVGGDGGPPTRFSDVAFAPSCRRCLALMDRHFPQPPAHDRLGLVAQVAADLVCEYGFAEVVQVPGDQQAALRKAIRVLVRKQSGHGSTTMVRNAAEYASCDAIFDQQREEHGRAAAEATSQALSGSGESRPVQRPEWRISWTTWTAQE
ncbi:hypothetical protein ABZ783_35970 [Micromonospora sp. NPDC047738]|uniref:hypothetical protein n=1 Tax=Micromonospora sp. NPDC047738 TaxID=3155741 RepID=UPI0033E488B1